MAKWSGNRNYGCINKEAVHKRAAILLPGYTQFSLYLNLSDQFKWSFICTNNATNKCNIALPKYLDLEVKCPLNPLLSFPPLTSMLETDACTKCVALETGTHCNWVTLGETSC